MVVLRAIIAVAAVLMAVFCGRRAYETFGVPTRSDTPVRAFYSVYFRWMWGLLRVSWTVFYASIALMAIVNSRAILYCVAWFPVSFILAFLTAPIAARVFKTTKPSGFDA